MLHLKVGIQLASLRQPFKKALDLATELGAQAVEIDARHEIRPQELSRTGIRQIRTLLDDRRLKVCAARFQTRRGFHVMDDLDRRIDAIKQAMKLAYELGASIVCTDLGALPQNQEGPEWELLVQVLTDLGRFGQKSGAMLAATTGSQPAAIVRQLMDRLPAGSLLIDFDPAELVVNRQSPDDAFQILGDDVTHFRVRDAVQDLSLGKGLEVQVGRGSVDFPTLLGKLEEKQYTGYLTVQRNDAENPILEVGQAVEYLHNLWS